MRSPSAWPPASSRRSSRTARKPPGRSSSARSAPTPTSSGCTPGPASGAGPRAPPGGPMASCQGLGGTGVKYSFAQLEALWINNGGAKAAAPVAAAIALAESSGCSTALNPSDNNGTQSSFGLWQISNGTHNPPVANIYDPNVNARQAVAKYKASGWAPWGTYASGAYRPFLNNATTPDMSIPGGSGAAGATLTSATSAPDPTCAASWPTFSASIIKLPGIP